MYALVLYFALALQLKLSGLLTPCSRVLESFFLHQVLESGFFFCSAVSCVMMTSLPDKRAPLVETLVDIMSNIFACYT